MNNTYKEGLFWDFTESKFYYNIELSSSVMATVYIEKEVVEKLVKKYLLEEGEIKNG